MKHIIQPKHSFLVAIMIVLLPMANMASAATFSSSSRAPSRSMKSGFSSQKSQPLRSDNFSGKRTGNTATNTSFGSFGQTSGKAAGRTDSALNKDLDRNQAQQQALKNMDARTQQKVALPAQASSVTGKPLDPIRAAPQTPSQMQQTPAAPTVIVQRESSSMGSAFMGFMLGQALSRPHSAPVHDNGRDDLEPIAGGGETGNDYRSTELDNASLPTTKAPPANDESAGWSMLRFLLWGAFLSGFSWIAYKLYRVLMPRREVVSHYSLGKV